MSNDNGTVFTLPEDLYDYQKEDLDRLLSDDTNWFNLSEMGTGKTPVSLGLVKEGGYKQVLIVCPKTIQLEWARQIKDWYGTDPAIGKGTYGKLEALARVLNGDTPFFITNYETFRIERHRDVLNRYPFDLVILDEAHKVRKPTTQMTRGLFEFASAHIHTRLMVLTGSPIVNNPADLHTLLCLLRPDEYSRRDRMNFIATYCYYERGRYGVKITGIKDLTELRKNTAQYTIRRTKKEVLPYLPDKYYKRVMLEMDKPQRESYDKMEKELFLLMDSGEPIWAPCVLALLTRLRQINLDPVLINVSAPSSKTDFLMDLIDDIDGKLVIFSTFETYIRFLYEYLKTSKNPVPSVIITGKQSMDERREAVDQFQSNPNIKLALGTIQSMGEGITLTESSNVVMMDRWWTPAGNSQAEDRLHRIGQKSAVQVIIPVNEKSVDESFDTILAAKGQFISSYLGEDKAMSEILLDLRQSRQKEQYVESQSQ